jgi:calcium binding protein 39
MKNFLTKEENLIIIMKLLLDNAKDIQYEAFKSFQNFIEFPKKSDLIVHRLKKNKLKLLKFLTDFQNDKSFLFLIFYR